MSFADVDLARLLIALAVLLLAAHGVGALFAKFKQPPAIGEIVGGILLGPSALGAALPSVQHWIFPSTGSSAAALGAVYQIGLLLLMFAAGTETRRLLQRDARFFPGQPALLQGGDGLDEQTGRDREMDGQGLFRRRPQRLAQRLEAVRIVEIGAMIVQAGQEGGQTRGVLAVARQIFFHRLFRHGTEVVGAHRPPRDPDQLESRGQEIFRMQGEQ